MNGETEVLENEESTDESVNPSEKRGWASWSRNKRIGVGVGGVVCALMLVAGGTAFALNQSNAESEVTGSVAVPAQTAAAKVVDKIALTFRVTAEGYNPDTSTPVIAHIESSDGEVDFYHAFDANTPHDIKVDGDKEYTVSYITPINADGSIYKVPEPTPMSNTIATPTFETIPADQVTEEQAKDVVTHIKDAVSKGDDTLTGDAGKDVVDNAAANIGKAPGVDKEVVDDTANAVPTPDTSVGTTPDSGNNTGSGSGGGAAADTNKVWHDPVYQTVHHDAEYSTVHHDAEYTTIYQDICNTCGHVLQPGESFRDHREAGGRVCTGYTNDVPATVEVSPAWDETVVVRDAWDEQVLVSDGYWA